jgi:hypothetical protein
LSPGATYSKAENLIQSWYSNCNVFGYLKSP